MAPAARAIAAAAAALSGIGMASAQTMPFPATDRRVASPLPPGGEAFRYRAVKLAPVPSGERPDDLSIALQRRTYRLGGAALSGAALSEERVETRSLSYDARARSRITAMRVEDRFALGEQIEARIGWRGFKVSNRNANATVDGGNDRLAAHDWFLPRASLAYRPAPAVTLSLGYRETMRAYEGAGSVGPLGLTRGEFDALRDTLRPERARQMRLDGQWQVDTLRVSLEGFHVDARDVLGFADHSYLPGNAGTVTVSGVSAIAEHRLTPTLSWSARYRRATVRSADARAVHEDEIGVGGVWTQGAWRGSLGTTRSAEAMRIEAGIEYDLAGLAARPLRLSARLTDPSRLASVRLLEDTGPLRAVDRARAMMVGATMLW